MKTGMTPFTLLRSKRFRGKTIFVKLEYHNESGNIKMRIAREVIRDAERKGVLVPHQNYTIVEASGGSMGIALATLAAAKGYHIKLVLPDNYSPDRIRQLPLYGADVMLSDHTTGNDSHFHLAKKIVRDNPCFFYADQLNNPANPRAHYLTTGREILSQIRDIDILVSVVGSGGTISGTGKRLKEFNPAIKVVAVQPEGCDVLRGTAIPHKIQGTAVGLVPSVFNTTIVDQIITVGYDEVMDMAHYLVKNEGLFLGISSCANILAAEKIAQQAGTRNRIVTLAPDNGQIYLNHYLTTKP